MKNTLNLEKLMVQMLLQGKCKIYIDFLSLVSIGKVVWKPRIYYIHCCGLTGKNDL